MQQHGAHVPLIQKKLILLVTAMRSVANNRVQNVRKVLSELMHSAGFRFGFHQGISRCSGISSFFNAKSNTPDVFLSNL